MIQNLIIKMSYGFTWKEKVVTTRMLFLLVQLVLVPFVLNVKDMESTSRYTELYSSPTERSRLIKFCDQVIKNQRPVITSGRDGGGIDEVGASTKETFQPVWCIVLQPEANVRGSSKTSGLFLEHFCVRRNKQWRTYHD